MLSAPQSAPATLHNPRPVHGLSSAPSIPTSTASLDLDRPLAHMPSDSAALSSSAPRSSSVPFPSEDRAVGPVPRPRSALGGAELAEPGPAFRLTYSQGLSSSQGITQPPHSKGLTDSASDRPPLSPLLLSPSPDSAYASATPDLYRSFADEEAMFRLGALDVPSAELLWAFTWYTVDYVCPALRADPSLLAILFPPSRAIAPSSASGSSQAGSPIAATTRPLSTPAVVAVAQEHKEAPPSPASMEMYDPVLMAGAGGTASTAEGSGQETSSGEVVNRAQSEPAVAQHRPEPTSKKSTYSLFGWLAEEE